MSADTLPCSPAVSSVPPSSAPLKSTGVSPNPSQAEILLAVANGRMTADEAGLLLAAMVRPVTMPPAVRARRTAKGAMWLSLGYRASAGCQNSTTLPRIGWEAVVRLVKDGTIPNLLAHFADIPLSASAKEGGAA